jgi:hypothetical protein
VRDHFAQDVASQDAHWSQPAVSLQVLAARADAPSARCVPVLLGLDFVVTAQCLV